MIAIVAVSQNWGIGKENQLLFSLPSDMKHFRQITTGGTVLMGRKTLESFPGGRPLPKRRNIVLTSGQIEREGVEVVHSVQEMLGAVKSTPSGKVFVIGGGTVYEALLPYCDEALLTIVDATPDADTFFPNLDADPSWKRIDESEPVEENGLTYRFINYRNTAHP